MKQESLAMLKLAMEAYAPLSDTTWHEMTLLCKTHTIAKNTYLYTAGEVPTSFAFVTKGLIRGFTLSDNGHEYNKNFFSEGQFPGSMTALLTSTPSRLAFETIEESQVVTIDFCGFRRLLFANKELMKFQIHYLEKNWLLHKDAREIELVQDDATLRYQQFTKDFPALVDRLPLYHIASHLGITPTQLSRIRSKLTLR
ncbi:Crp/Fnr family transcriptional regulator [Aestuariibacter sp. A3R04]|uniref:Crp/Fnr family transcriptional regulator n=1 Tax=Aestuariibacter sp. A3R04 TaxID=2841571 RepID=UPI0020903D3D|nr:Crp/Fnr family transcriptional regulator [Aestuariibacter sp. A3R04]